MGPALLSLLAWSSLSGQKSALFSWHLSSSVLCWLQGAVEEGLGLSSAIITALIHAGTPRSVSNSSRDTLCVQPCCRQYNGTLLLFTQECRSVSSLCVLSLFPPSPAHIKAAFPPHTPYYQLVCFYLHPRTQLCRKL